MSPLLGKRVKRYWVDDDPDAGVVVGVGIIDGSVWELLILSDTGTLESVRAGDMQVVDAPGA